MIAEATNHRLTGGLSRSKMTGWIGPSGLGRQGDVCVTRFEEAMFAAPVTQQGIARGKEDKRNRTW